LKYSVRRYSTDNIKHVCFVTDKDLLRKMDASIPCYHKDIENPLNIQIAENVYLKESDYDLRRRYLEM
jgi:hypothetical protein